MQLVLGLENRDGLPESISVIPLDTPLGQFLAGYFHPDWASDHGSTEEVVDYFVRNSGPQHVGLVRAQLVDYLAQTARISDSELSKELASVGAYFSCNKEPRSAKEWLAAVANRLSASS